MTKDEKVTPATPWAIGLNLENELANLEADRKGAERWRKLIRLIGTYPNDIECSLSYGLERGIPVAIIIARSSYEGKSFDSVIDQIPG